MRLPSVPRQWSPEFEAQLLLALESRFRNTREVGDIELQRVSLHGPIRHEGLYLWGPDDVRYELRDYLRLRQKTVAGTTYEIVRGDEHYVLETTNSSPVTITVPTNANAAFPVRSLVHFHQYGSGLLSIQGDTGVTVRYRTGLSLNSAGRYSMFSVWKRDTDEWVLFGDIAAA